MAKLRISVHPWVFAFLLCVPGLLATPGRPLGVYVKVYTEEAVAGYPGSGTPTAAQLHVYFQNLLAGVLADPAISGIVIEQHWDNIQPTSATTYDWSYFDDAFAEAAAVNKTVQLIVTPGFNSPQWLLSQLTSCDPLFTSGSAPATCGKVKFAQFPEEQRSDGVLLPLPWNSTYQTAWATFLTALNSRYGSNPLFVAFNIAGPVGGSDEMIYPDDQNDSATQPSGLSVDDTWAALIQNAFPNKPGYPNTDQAFIDAWDQFIDMHEKIFSGINLFLAPDAGNDFPGFSKDVTPHSDNTLYTVDCANFINGDKSQLMSCEAKTEILSYFLATTVPNAKGTQTSGLTASVPDLPGDIGMAGVKVLTGLSPAPANFFSGGAEFDFAVTSTNLQAVGCNVAGGNCPGLTPELGEYNVLTAFFYGTPAATFYGGATGSATVQYLDVPYEDVQYAQFNTCPPMLNPVIGSMSLQDLLNRASRDLYAIAGISRPLPPPTCASSVPVPSISEVANAEGENPAIAANTWIEIKGTNLATPGDSRTWTAADFTGGQMPAALDQVSVTINGENAYIYYISPTQINALTPPDLSAGPLTVVVNHGGVASYPFVVQSQAVSPSFFVFNGGPYAIAVHADGTLIGPTSLYPGATTPAQPGETVVIFANGFGATSTPVTAGSSSQSGQLSPLPAVTIGGAAAKVGFAGLISPGLFQFNVTIPSTAASGDNPISATYQGVNTTPSALITVAGTPPPPTTVTFYVAPNGNDQWSGTLSAPNAAGTDGPLATFDRARALLQSISKSGLTNMAVQFRGGTYYLSSTVMFTPADSGTATTPIVYQNYPGESPVFSGGVRVTNWSNVSGNVWKTTLPASTQFFENLFYNGKRRLRPRLGATTSASPLGAFYRIATTVYLNAPAPPAQAPNANCPVYIGGSGWECFDRFQYSPGDPVSGAWKNLAPSPGNACGQPAGNSTIAGDIEVLDFEQFNTSKLRISCIDTTNHIVYLTGPTKISQTNASQAGFIAGNRYLVDNVEDELTQPGQWFLDRSTTPWTLTYLANPGENPNADSVIVPQEPQLLVATGLQYVTFQGLTFEHDNYTVPATGHASSELEADISAAVSFQNSQYITFDSGIVTQTSGSGIEFIPCLNATSPAYCVSTSVNAAVSHDVVQNSAIYDIGAVGVRIGNPFQPADNDSNVPQFVTVENTVVEGYGRTIPAAFGIGQGMGHDNLYTHNDVYDGYHCAISTSQSIGDTTMPAGIGNANTVISFNHVYNLLQGIMNDGGSIRIDGGNEAFTAAGNKILNNRIHDVTDAGIQDSNGYGGNGIYLDNDTGLVDVENNLVYRVSGYPVYTPHGPAAPNEANTIKNNILAFGRQAMFAVSFPYGYGVPAIIPRVFLFSNNMFYFDRSNTSTPKFWVQGGCLYAGGAAYTQFQDFTSNIYWRTDGAFANDTKAFAVQPNAGTGPNAPCSANTNDWTFYTFAAWQSNVNEDVQSIVANPGFNNPAFPADDYSLPKGSPGAGFVVFDYTQAGRSNAVIQPPSVAATFPTKTYNPASDY
ncbi:MAG TPA: IPT/TIG domain-containing protein [Bryobacteraceae bacterium]|nr:IPT/TIG domain-containing protein [Bryobacteraceae bacterium]